MGRVILSPLSDRKMTASLELSKTGAIVERGIRAGLCVIALLLVAYNVAPAVKSPAAAVSDSAVAYFAAPEVHHIDSNRYRPPHPSSQRCWHTRTHLPSPGRLSGEMGVHVCALTGPPLFKPPSAASNAALCLTLSHTGTSTQSSSTRGHPSRCSGGTTTASSLFRSRFISVTRASAWLFTTTRGSPQLLSPPHQVGRANLPLLPLPPLPPTNSVGHVPSVPPGSAQRGSCTHPTWDFKSDDLLLPLQALLSSAGRTFWRGCRAVATSSSRGGMRRCRR